MKSEWFEYINPLESTLIINYVTVLHCIAFYIILPQSYFLRAL